MNTFLFTYEYFRRRSWVRSIFAWSGTALPVCFFRILIAVVYCVLLQIGWSFQNTVFEHLDPFGHAVLGSLIGFLLVMRMNASNARYWEGRSHWGAIVNASRNLARTAAAYTSEGRDFADLVAGYAISLRQSLRDSRDLSDARPFLPEHLMQVADVFGNQPSAVAAAMTHWVARQTRNGNLPPGIVYYLEEQIATLVDAQGGCEKIQKTPLPFAYVSLIRLLILIYLATLPMVTFGILGWWSPVLMAIVALGLFGMEEASVEIEDPFGTEPNCLKLEVLTITIARDSGQLAAYSDLPQQVDD